MFAIGLRFYLVPLRGVDVGALDWGAAAGPMNDGSNIQRIARMSMRMPAENPSPALLKRQVITRKATDVLGDAMSAAAGCDGRGTQTD
jgi:hypothetical protein